jgi:predicted metal-dependent phosphoesterase TrpH
MVIELHCHSHRSDGTDPPRVVAGKAHDAGAKLFALTDHDTWSGHADTLEVAPDMRVLRGMELSCAHQGRTVHLLMWGLTEGPALDRLATELQEAQRRRRERIGEICARFLKWDIHLDPEAVITEARGGTPGRPHVARALLKAGVVKSVREAFDRFLHDGGPADVPGPRLPVDEGAALGVAAGARVSMAHPHTVGHPYMVRAVLERARAGGLGGMEAFYGAYGQRDRAGWLEMAAELELVPTGGSDYHGIAVQPDVLRPGVELPEPHERRLLEWLGVA